MKKVLFACSLFLVGVGCVPVDAEPHASVSTVDAALWIVSGVTAKEIQYAPLEWLTGDEAVQAARADGMECGTDQACLPNGYYLRYPNGEGVTSTWTLGDTSTISVQLICNTDACVPDSPRENGYKTMSFAQYVAVSQSCTADPFTCPYYGIGAGGDFFDIQFGETGELSSMIERYVP